MSSPVLTMKRVYPLLGQARQRLYRFVTPPDGAMAFALGREVQRGALSAGKPFLSPA